MFDYYLRMPITLLRTLSYFVDGFGLRSALSDFDTLFDLNLPVVMARLVRLTPAAHVVLAAGYSSQVSLSR